MPGDPNKLSRFWQELKRRKVVRVITIYAAVAFVILQLVEILAPSLRLPEWTMNFILVLLIVGFLIAVILSWIYDIHPEGGIVKTEPTTDVRAEPVPSSSKSWKIATYISFIVIVGLIILNVVPRANNNREILDKSVAVLPFRNDSPDQERMYFINGTMEAILDNLCKIEDLRVPGRTSVEQYRNNPKPIPTVAEEMNVSYILEGSGHRDGNNVRLIVQLLDGKRDQHLWSKTYDSDIEEIFSMQSEIAQLVAAEIEAIITPEEKQRIEIVPTTNLTAHDFYQRGREEHWKYLTDPHNLMFLDKAEELYNKALSFDSTFSLAYLGLAEAYWNKNYVSEYLSKDFMDSALVLANMALSYDKKLYEAYVLRGDYFRETGYENHALEEYNKALYLNPNSWEAYLGRAEIFFMDDLVSYADNLHKAATINRGKQLPYMLRSIADNFSYAGFHEIAKEYAHQALKIDNDTTNYFSLLAGIEYSKGNLENAIQYYHKGYLLDSTNMTILYFLGSHYSFTGQYEKSLIFFEKWLEQIDNTLAMSFQNMGMHRVGCAYWKNKRPEEATQYFDTQLKYINGEIEKDLPRAQKYFSYYDRAGIYAFRAERDKAFEDLRIFNQIARIPAWLSVLIKVDPLFDNIRDEPEFQQIVRDVEAKYQAEHERVRKWLEENDML